MGFQPAETFSKSLWSKLSPTTVEKFLLICFPMKLIVCSKTQSSSVGTNILKLYELSESFM